MTGRHPATGRFLAYDCEVDCLVHCAGLCGEVRAMRTIRCLWCHGDFGDDIGAYLDHRPCSRRVTAAATAGPGDTPLVVRPPARPAATPHR